jgi:hypothetical protein
LLCALLPAPLKTNDHIFPLLNSPVASELLAVEGNQSRRLTDWFQMQQNWLSNASHKASDERLNTDESLGKLVFTLELINLTAC